MTKRTCTVDECDREALARTFCNAHYKQWSKGRPFTPPKSQYCRAPGTEIHELIESRTEFRPSGCQQWMGAVDTHGYGVTSVAGKQVRLHRWVYEQEHGSVDGATLIDHTCWNRACVELAHLRPVNRSQNGSNRERARPGSASGVRNVYPVKSGFRVSVMRDGKLHHFGVHPTIDAAKHVAEGARAQLFGEYAGRG